MRRSPTPRNARFWFVVAASTALLTGCEQRPTNFSQFPGFSAYFAANPPSSALPSATEKALLETYRPRLFVATGQEGPIDFYRDYIGHGTLSDGKGTVLSRKVTRKVLNRYKSAPTVVFVHRPGKTRPRPVAYGRVDRHDVDFPGHGTERFLFLTWHFTFRQSGLPAGMSVMRAGLASLFASRKDWHQLDHYTAATIALDAERRPVALILQQHNYMRTYLIGSDVVMPADRRVRLVAAIDSNELYPYRNGTARRRAAGFLTRDSLAYIMKLGPKPFRAADDITRPDRQIDYRLSFLPPSDAFYTFAGFLGERRWLPGRDGPPGADFNTLPTIKGKPRELFLFYFRPKDRRHFRVLAPALDVLSRSAVDRAIRAQTRAFHQDLQAIRTKSAARR